ncbi:hypothetical protein [Prevotella histicola]
MANVDNVLTDREMYRLKDGIMHQHFNGFNYKWGENRIYCAKVTKEGEIQWIKWSDNNGYNLNNVRRGDIIMMLKMHPKHNRTIDKIYYKVISRRKDRLVCEWANGDIVYTTYRKALKAPLPKAKECKELTK